MMQQILTNIGDLVTLTPLVQQQRRSGITLRDLGRLGPDAWLATASGKVVATGVGPVPPSFAAWQRRDLAGALVLPGLVDSHTHALFAGSRAGEFCQRAEGATYQEIAAAGGGISATMAATRGAGDESLTVLLRQRLDRFLRLGVTTVEVKSGYGLSVAAELRLLRLLKDVRQGRRQHVHPTCLALHAPSPEHPSLPAYVAACCDELLPVVAAEGLASSVDAFIEAGYFSVKEAQPYFAKARSLGLGLRLHADEFSDAGAAAAAAAWGAASADHLQCASQAALPLMAASGVTATLLPGTSLYTKIAFTQARPFIEHGIPVAIASDFNPGSCQIDALAMLATVACVQNGLRPAEAVAAVTYVPACSLGLGRSKGALAVGFDADLVAYPLASVEEWVADFGRTEPSAVLVGGL